MKRILATIAIATLAVFGIGTTPALAAPSSGDLSYVYVSSGPIPQTVVAEYIVTNDTGAEASFYVVYNDESGTILTSPTVTLAAGESSTVASTQLVQGNGVKLSATLYSSDGKRIETIRPLASS